MKKIVIAGSAKLQNRIDNWINYFKNKSYEVLDFPKKINELTFMNAYPSIHTEFFENITKTDVLFIMNEDKNGVEGYIGYETYAELTFGLAQKLIYKRNIELVILKIPSKEVGCYEEINLWIKLGWIKLFN